MRARRNGSASINKLLERRLRALEIKSGIDTKPLLLVRYFVKPNGQFGGERCKSDRAQASDRIWHRNEGESQDDFEKRVLAEARELKGAYAIRVIFWPSDSNDQWST
jgi:hypothetical protein